MDLDGRKTRGRQKIEIKKIKDVNVRLITFSKRRAGIYKKACELATLCGAQIGIIIFSPTGKPFSFGQPTIGAVLERFLNRNISGPMPNGDNLQSLILEDQEKRTIEELSQTLDETLTQLEAEKKRGKSLVQSIKHVRVENAKMGEIRWWEAKIEELRLLQLEQASASLEQFYGHLMNFVNQQGTNKNHNNDDNMVGSSNSPWDMLNLDTDLGDYDGNMEELPEKWW